MYCFNCGKKIADGSLFCENCGVKQETGSEKIEQKETEVLQNAEGISEQSQGGEFEYKKYSFEMRKYLFGYSDLCYCIVYTDIIVDRYVAEVHTWKKTFGFKYGHKKEEININDITEISVQKVYSWGWIVYAILMLIGFMIYKNILFILGALISIFFLKKKKIYITHKGGKIYIPDEGSIGMDRVEDMIKNLCSANSNIHVINL